jgi:hypothetical protein
VLNARQADELRRALRAGMKPAQAAGVRDQPRLGLRVPRRCRRGWGSAGRVVMDLDRDLAHRSPDSLAAPPSPRIGAARQTRRREGNCTGRGFGPSTPTVEPMGASTTPGSARRLGGGTPANTDVPTPTTSRWV